MTGLVALRTRLARESPQALQLQTATLDYEKAVNAFNAKFSPTDSALKASLAQVQQAKTGTRPLAADARKLGACRGAN